jgi:hypothetical protein
MNDAKYIGPDVHQGTISVSVLDGDGKLVMEAILETKRRRFCHLCAGCAAVCRRPLRKEPVPPGCTICSSPTLHTSWSVIRAKITWEKVYGRDRSAKEIVREGKVGFSERF